VPTASTTPSPGTNTPASQGTKSAQEKADEKKGENKGDAGNADGDKKEEKANEGNKVPTASTTPSPGTNTPASQGTKSAQEKADEKKGENKGDAGNADGDKKEEKANEGNKVYAFLDKDEVVDIDLTRVDGGEAKADKIFLLYTPAAELGTDVEQLFTKEVSSYDHYTIPTAIDA
ncbi:hypothetical protein Tcan_09803, partial [Toxocara canis]